MDDLLTKSIWNYRGNGQKVIFKMTSHTNPSMQGTNMSFQVNFQKRFPTTIQSSFYYISTIVIT